MNWESNLEGIYVMCNRRCRYWNVYSSIKEKSQGMNTFQRYLIHFTLFVSVIISVLVSLVFMDTTINASKKFIFEGKEKLEVVGDIDEKKKVQLEEIIQKKLKRNIRKDNGNISIYTMKNRYQSWLTNPIEIIQDKDIFVIKTPRAYQDDIQKVCLCKVI